MKKSAIYYVLLSCFMVFAMYGCSEDDSNILSDLEDLPAPTLTSIVEAVGFGGAEATIEGTGFSTNPANNLITFGPSDDFGYLSVRAEQATSTRLTFTKPVISAVGETIFTKVRTSRLDDVTADRSNELDVSFLPLLSVFADGFQRSRGIAFDSNGDGYVSDMNPLAVYKITEAGNVLYVQFPATNLRGEIEFDSQGNLWVATAWQALYKIPPGGGAFEEVDIGSERARSISFDANGNLYMGNYEINRLAPDGTLTFIDLGEDGALCSTVADGYLYWWIKGGALRKAAITAEGIGAIETILEPEEDQYWPSAIVVDTDGNVYGAGGWCDKSANCTNIYKITPDGTVSTVYELGIENMWGLEFRGEYLYAATQEEGSVLKCYMFGAVGAGR